MDLKRNHKKVYFTIPRERLCVRRYQNGSCLSVCLSVCLKMLLNGFFSVEGGEGRHSHLINFVRRRMKEGQRRRKARPTERDASFLIPPILSCCSRLIGGDGRTFFDATQRDQRERRTKPRILARYYTQSQGGKVINRRTLQSTFVFAVKYATCC